MKFKYPIYILSLVFLTMGYGCAGGRKYTVVKVVKPKNRISPYSSIKNKNSKRTKTVRYRSL
ncbi:MAG: hypothetical protein RIG77_12570 [Cyclobacteriaceae bacterium]